MSEKLKQLYEGRRKPATPAQIQRTITEDIAQSDNFPNLLEVYSPTQKDIDEKGDNYDNQVDRS